ncbi:MAG: hypothetical protein R3F59_36335, partial [Myxococcota bacterium]
MDVSRPVETDAWGQADLLCPFEVDLHPETMAVNVRTQSWLHRMSLLDPSDHANRLKSEQYTWLATRMFPEAPPHVVQVISDYTSWLFVHDDLCDESSFHDDPLAMGAWFERALNLLMGN